MQCEQVLGNASFGGGAQPQLRYGLSISAAESAHRIDTWASQLWGSAVLPLRSIPDAAGCSLTELDGECSHSRNVRSNPPWCLRDTHTHINAHTCTHAHAHAHAHIHTHARTCAGRGSTVVAADVLWSDPVSEPGLQENDQRGVGLTFGPDVTQVRPPRQLAGSACLVPSGECASGKGKLRGAGVTGHALWLLEKCLLEDYLMEQRSRGVGATEHAFCLLEMPFLEDCLMDERVGV